MIGGFIITGNDPKRIVIRGLGRSLESAGFQDLIPDPLLRLFGATGSQIAQNDDWEDTQSTDLRTTGLAPKHPLESAILATLNPGAYTALVSGKNGATGIGLVEIYDANQPSNSKLTNISTRGVVKTGDNVLIGGFILGGSSIIPTKVVVRALGPSLQQGGLAALSDPSLTLFNSDGQALASNDNWQDNANQAQQLQTLAIAPPHPAESAILATLPPGNYTAIVSGKSGGTGIGLIEVYNVQ